MNTKRQTAGKTADRHATRRNVTRNKGQGAASPHNARKRYNGTAAEVRDAKLMPWERDMLSVALRHVHRSSTGELRNYMAETAADRRKSVLEYCLNGTPSDFHIPTTSCTRTLMIRLRAAARLMGATVADFVADALAAAVEAAEEKAHGRGLPYTRHERTALAYIGEQSERRTA